jgi:N-acetylmuramoyl-L-alanine amidase
MGKVITMEQGDCLVNISASEGFFWETVWKHPENTGLRHKRKHYNIVKAGDRLFVPDREIKWHPAVTEIRHRFVRRGTPVMFTLVVSESGKPRANEKYVLRYDTGETLEGVTDADGRLKEPIPADVSEGRLLLGDDEDEIVIHFGHVDPIGEISGVQTRLRNLGFYEGEIDDDLTEETVVAIAEFNRASGLPGEGTLTDETRQALVAAHGS